MVLHPTGINILKRFLRSRGPKGLDRLQDKFKDLPVMLESRRDTNKKPVGSTRSDEKPTRDAYGEELAKLGEEKKEIVVLEADISKSTRTRNFADKFPERFFQFGVAEANMMAAAAGFASTGKIPFVSTYSVFSSMRACEQVRTFNRLSQNECQDCGEPWRDYAWQ